MSRTPLRIGIDARFYGGEQSKGLGRYTQKLIEHLLSIDEHNQYVIFVQEEQFAEWEKLHGGKIHPNVNLVEAPYRWYSIAEQLFMPIKIWQHKVDFMHFPHFNVPLFYRGKFIVTIHDLIISRFPTERATTLGPMMYRIKQLAYNLVIRHAAKDAHRIITVSEYSKADIQDFFSIPADKITVTYEAVDPFPSATDSFDDYKVLQRYNIEKPYMLYVGNAYPHKNIETVLRAVATLKRENRLFAKLVLVGKDDYFYLRIKQQAWALDIEDVVQFTGFVADEDLPSLYRSAFAYIFPSRYEGFGLPPLEAMYYNTPVISSNSSCLPEILGEAALYFDYKDENGIISQIFRLYDDPTLNESLRAKGQQQVQKYNWLTMAEQTLALYESATKPQT